MSNARASDCCSAPISAIPLSGAERSRLVALFKALGDDTRLEVFHLIAKNAEPVCVCDIVDRFTVSQPTISHHLKVLREAGLITLSRRGNWSYYAPDPRGLAETEAAMGILVSPPVGMLR